MKKSVFPSMAFYFCLIGYILLLIVYNCYMGLKNNNIYAFLPITIQLILLVLLFTKDRYSKIVILVWATVFLIIACSLDIIGNLLGDFASNFQGPKLNILIYDLITVSIGVLIVTYAKAITISDMKASDGARSK
jgi:hypothetical protein